MTEGGEHEVYMHVVTNLLLKLGFQAGTRGYRYLRDAVVGECSGLEHTASMTKMLYPELAVRYGITDKQVERAIRTAVETAWSEHGDEAWDAFFDTLGQVREERPTNKEMIDTLADMVKRSAADEGWHQYCSTGI